MIPNPGTGDFQDIQTPPQALTRKRRIHGHELRLARGSPEGPVIYSAGLTLRPDRHSNAPSADDLTGRISAFCKVMVLHHQRARRRGHEDVRTIHRACPTGRRPGPGRGAGRSSTTTSAPSTSCWDCCAKTTAWRRACSTRSTSPWKRCAARSPASWARVTRSPRADPLHAARQEGARAGAARGAVAGPQLHRHRAHPAGPGARERGRGRPHPLRPRRRRRPDPPGGHAHAVRPRPALAGPGAPAGGREGRRRAPRCSTSSAAT